MANINPIVVTKQKHKLQKTYDFSKKTFKYEDISQRHLRVKDLINVLALIEQFKIEIQARLIFLSCAYC